MVAHWLALLYCLRADKGVTAMEYGVIAAGIILLSPRRPSLWVATLLPLFTTLGEQTLRRWRASAGSAGLAPSRKRDTSRSASTMTRRTGHDGATCCSQRRRSYFLLRRGAMSRAGQFLTASACCFSRSADCPASSRGHQLLRHRRRPPCCSSSCFWLPIRGG